MKQFYIISSKKSSQNNHDNLYESIELGGNGIGARSNSNWVLEYSVFGVYLIS